MFELVNLDLCLLQFCSGLLLLLHNTDLPICAWFQAPLHTAPLLLRSESSLLHSLSQYVYFPLSFFVAVPR